MILRELVAKIRHLFHAEHWKIGTIAAELGLHAETVRTALETDRFNRTRVARPSVTDPYVDFIRKTLEQYPRLRATRIYHMIRDRGYPLEKLGYLESKESIGAGKLYRPVSPQVEEGEGGIAKMAAPATPTRQTLTAKRRTAGEELGIAAADIQKTVERIFKVAVRQSGFSERAVGIYKWMTRRKGPPSPEVVRTKESYYANLAVLAHEVAHHVDETTKAVRSMPKEVRDEIANLDYEPEKGRAFEGWAEFVRRYITEPPIDVDAHPHPPSAGPPGGSDRGLVAGDE